MKSNLDKILNAISKQMVSGRQYRLNQEQVMPQQPRYLFLDMLRRSGEAAEDFSTKIWIVLL